MPTFSFRLAALALVLCLPARAQQSAADLLPPAPAAPLPAMAQAEVKALKAMAEACQAGDVPRALGTFADDGSIRLSVEGMPDELFEGRSWIRVFWELHAKGCKLEVGAPGPEGVQLTLANERFRALGAPQVTLRARATLRVGEISDLHLTLDPAQAPTIARAILTHNKSVVIRFHDKINRKEDQSAVNECVASEYQQHSIMPVSAGIQGLREFYQRFRAAFPDIHYTIEDTRVDGDMVVTRMTVRMTHRGEFMGVPATGRPVIVTKMDFWRLMSGKVVEHWDAVDRLGMLQQLGVVPKLSDWQASPGYEGFR